MCPLFSYSYKPLFAQALCFDIHTNRPGGCGGPSAHPRHALLPASYAPRGASIPCGLKLIAHTSCHHGGVRTQTGVPSPKSSRTRSSETRHILHNLGQCKQFRINTCKSVSKQMTLTPFRINTYRKRGGGGVGKIRAFTLPAAASPAAQNLCPGSAQTRTPPRSWSPDGLAVRSAVP